MPLPSSTRGVERLVGRRGACGAKRVLEPFCCCRVVREEAALALLRRDCWEVFERREGCVALEFVGWRGAMVKGSCGG